MYIAPLDTLDDLRDVGQKCASIARLASLGVNVPPAFGVTFTAFQDFIAPLLPKIKALVKTCDASVASQAIREMILDRDVPPAIEDALSGALSRFPHGALFAVRSSGQATSAGIAVVEDSAMTSLAGQFESFLGVEPSLVRHALKQCWAALYNERTLRLFQARVDDSFFDSRMSVVVQVMIAADISAVVMTRDPVQAAEVLAMEVAFGPCEALVSGRVTGDLLTVDRHSHQVVGREIGSKRHRVVYQPYSEKNRGAYDLEPVEENLRSCPAIDDLLAGRISEICLGIEACYGCPLDLELVVAGGQIFVVQARGITTPVFQP